MAHTMKTGLTLLTAIIAASAGATDYATIAQPVVAYASNGNTSTTLLALPAMIANTNEATYVMGNVVPGEIINSADVAMVHSQATPILTITGNVVEVKASENSGSSTLAIFDATGRKLGVWTLQNGRASIMLPGAGVYLVKMEGYSQKIVIHS